MTPSHGLNRRTVEISGSWLSLIDAGNGPPILLGHGYLWNSDMWGPQINLLVRNNRVIVPDMWGHGQSGPLPDGTRDLAGLAAQMVDLLDHLGIERCVVVGLSMGGMWGAHLAAAAPDRVAGLVMMNSFLGEEPLQRRTTYSALLDSVEWEGGFSRHVTDVALPLFFAAGIDDHVPGLRQRLRDQIDAFSTEQVRGSIAPIGRLIFDREDGLGILGKIQCPHLIVGGAKDAARPPEESILMASLLGSEPTIIADCGHTSSLEKGDEVNRILGDFLSEIRWRA